MIYLSSFGNHQFVLRPMTSTIGKPLLMDLRRDCVINNRDKIFQSARQLRTIGNWIVVTLAVGSLFSSCSENVVRSDLPLTWASAVSQYGLKLPASAHNIYFLLYGGGLQDLESYTRFDVAPSELESAVETLIAENNKISSATSTYPKQPLSPATITRPRKDFLPMPWWDPSSVKIGYFRGEEKSYALQIIVDEPRSRIYIYQND